MATTIEVALRRHRYEEDILHLSRYDPLTGLPNRLSLTKRLEEHCAEPSRAGDFALHIVDLDRFKIVNDTYGHAAGDELLKAVAERLRLAVGAADFVARLGGDEFAVIQRLSDFDAEAADLAGMICEALSRPFPVRRASLIIGASIGVASGRRDGAQASELLKAADLALYAAKAAERGAFRFYSPAMTQSAQSRLKIEVGLRTALQNDEFQIVYQPITSIAADRISGFEALLRWRRGHVESIPPSEFIPVAEDLGLIVEIGAWALNRACAEIAAAPGGYSLSVNGSPAQFETTDFARTVRDALAGSGLAPQRLHIEITESMLMKDNQRILDQLKEIRALGVGVSIDDFGTGYSCLSYLEIYPIDTIKIDRQFVNKIGQRAEAGATLRAIVDLAASFGMTTIAEGVETREQMAALRENGCTGAQGYLLGRPGPLGDFIAAGPAAPRLGLTQAA